LGVVFGLPKRPQIVLVWVLKRPPQKVGKGVCGRGKIAPFAREHSAVKKHLEVLGNTQR
jgi:hypothetical protein